MVAQYFQIKINSVTPKRRRSQKSLIYEVTDFISIKITWWKIIFKNPNRDQRLTNKMTYQFYAESKIEFGVKNLFVSKHNYLI